MTVHPKKLDLAEFAEVRVPAERRTASSERYPWRVVGADGSTRESSMLGGVQGENEGECQSLPEAPSHGVSDVFKNQTASQVPPRAVGLEELGLSSGPPSAAPAPEKKVTPPKLSVLAKPHAGMPGSTLDVSSGLGLDVHIPPKASEAGPAVAAPHWQPAEPEETQTPAVTSEAPSSESLDPPPETDGDRQLLRMINAWPSLSVGVRDAIVTMAEASLDR